MSQDGSRDSVSLPADVATGDDVAADAVSASDVTEADLPLALAVDFTADDPREADGAVFAEVRLGDNDDELVVTLYAEGFEDVVGWAFDLRYRPSLVAPLAVSFDEDLLRNAYGDGHCVATARGPGRLNIGCARVLRELDLMGVSARGDRLDGPARFATLRFQREGLGAFELAFDPLRRVARDGDGRMLDVDWRGGSVSIEMRPGGGVR